MIRRIIVAFDGSAESRRAFHASLSIARAGRIGLRVLHAVEPLPPPLVMADPISGLDPNPILADVAADDAKERAREREHFKRLLEQLAAEAEKAGVACETMVEDGALLDRLVNLAGGDDLLAVGLKGRFARAGVGSTTKRLVTSAPCPVLVAGAEGGEIGSVVAAYDGTAPSKRAGCWAAAAAKQCGWPLSLAVPQSNSALAAEATEMAPGSAVASLAGDGSHQFVKEAAASAERGGGMLVMGAYAEPWYRQLFQGTCASDALAAGRGVVVLVH